MSKYDVPDFYVPDRVAEESYQARYIGEQELPEPECPFDPAERREEDYAEV